ncbi:NAD(P)/FAD-dependent oxidoreductase [Clostridium ganghwense]|uniref:FAD-dependent oxidoreductase n=1 Tax=Clostridium ganghwense TaxID=312089 RepID=A0ABT4CUR3_9CLOT|nr:FAD-dependent oxidoreductase [Clostridium ganghwense]
MVGAGIAGIFAAYELNKINPSSNILIIEKGKEIKKRVCPIKEQSIEKCNNCRICHIKCGWGGVGKCEGKYNYTNNFGGDLYKYIGHKKALELMNYVDKINCNFGDRLANTYSTYNKELEVKAEEYGLKLLHTKVRHLGTLKTEEILLNMYNYLKDKVEIIFDTEVINIISKGKENDSFTVETQNRTYYSNKLILATGISSSNWTKEQCTSLDIKVREQGAAIGLRLEVPASIFKKVIDSTYEAKFSYRTEKTKDFIITYCMNPWGRVITKHTNGMIMVDGQNYLESNEPTNNINFTLFVSDYFKSEDNIIYSKEFADSVIKVVNSTGGGVLVQRFGDMIKGKVTSYNEINNNTTKPTLDATPFDLNLVIPKRLLNDIIEMIYVLDKMVKGIADENTLVYAAETKYYNPLVQVNENLETKVKDLYMAGDCSGITHSLSQAAASGIYVGKNIGING